RHEQADMTNRTAFRLALVTLTSALLFAGCAGKRADIPGNAAIAAPAGWRTSVESPGPVHARWWEQFNDQTLHALVEEAVAGTSDLRWAEPRVRESQAQYRLAVARRRIDTAFGLEVERKQDVNAFGQEEEATDGGAKLLASYDLDLFGRLKSSAAAARADFLGTKAGRDELQLLVSASAASGYVELLAADARLRILQQTLAARANSLRLVQRRASVGYGSQLELHQAQAEYDATLQQIPDAQLSIAQLENS